MTLKIKRVTLFESSSSLVLHPVWYDLSVQPPLPVHVCEMLLKHDVLQGVLGNGGAAVKEAAETVVHGQNLEKRGR
jgi:hypothetical protein